MDVTLNEDRLCRDGGYSGPFTDMYLPGTLKRQPAAPVTEPVTLAEAKTYLKITYGTDDVLIGDLITAARVWCEEHIGQSIVKTNIGVTVNVVNFIELPYGPVQDTTTIIAATLDPKYILKGDFPAISGTKGQFEVRYLAGYTNVPEWAKKAILARVAATYENRGDQDKTNYAQVARSYLGPHKRITAWV